MGQDEKATYIHKPNEMDADHVTAWSKGGKSDLANCEIWVRSSSQGRASPGGYAPVAALPRIITTPRTDIPMFPPTVFGQDGWMVESGD